jgi:hypothetical protein
MRIALLIVIVLVLVAVAAYFLFFPRNTDFVILSRPSGGTVTFSRTGVSFEAAPDHYSFNGFEHIEPYVTRFLVPTNKFKFLNFFTPDGNRGFGFSAKDGLVQASLFVDWRKQPEREAAIRAFFSSLGIAPSRDYLAGNGGVPDATRVLEYPVNGTPSEVTALTRRILQELCGVSPAEALDISYQDK